jgi:hypothetical protein
MIGMAALGAACVLVPWAHATAKCVSGDVEERVYELVEIEAVDGGTVPETVQERWVDGAWVVARSDGFEMVILAIDEAVVMEPSTEVER